MTIRRFPTLWHVEQIPGGGPGLGEASGQALAYVYARETKATGRNCQSADLQKQSNGRQTNGRPTAST